MRFAALQYPIVWGNTAANLRLASERIAALAGEADVAVLPEMFATGFCSDQPELAEDEDGEIINTLQSISDATGIAIISTFMCRTGDKIYNRGFLISPFALPQWQDKRHLYFHGGEDKFFTPGTKRQVMVYGGVRILLTICYDLRFPVWNRNATGNDYDVIVVCGNWPQARVAHWDAMIPSRGIENLSYIMAVNLVGDDGWGRHYNGHSAAYDTYGKELLGFHDDEAGTRIADFNIGVLRHFREVLPLWKDNDWFELKS